MTRIETLQAAVQAVAPIYGVSIGTPSDKTTWRIDFQPGATQAQRDAAQSVVNGYDITAPFTNAEKDADLQAFLDSAGGKVVKSLVAVLVSKGTLTKAEIAAVYHNL